MTSPSESSSSHRIPLRALIVDDSRIFRAAVAAAFHGIGDCSVSGSVFSGEKALEFLAKEEVDLITLDVEMPGMNGLEVLSEIQRRLGVKAPPVLMISAHTRSGAQVTVEALANGAFGFVSKPEAGNPQLAMAELQAALRDQVAAVRGMLASGAPGTRRRSRTTGTSSQKRNLVSDGLILIGSSTGGPQALSELLPALGHLCTCPIMVVQHMPPLFTRSLADSLDRRCRQTVVEVSSGMRLEPKHIYIARGGSHLEVLDVGGLSCHLSSGEPEHGMRPSVNVLFRSAAKLRGRPVVAAVLTGMGGDGSSALSALSTAGATILAQSEESCVVYGMPRMAVATGRVDRVVHLENMAEAIVEALLARPE